MIKNNFIFRTLCCIVLISQLLNCSNNSSSNNKLNDKDVTNYENDSVVMSIVRTIKINGLWEVSLTTGEKGYINFIRLNDSITGFGAMQNGSSLTHEGSIEKGILKLKTYIDNKHWGEIIAPLKNKTELKGKYSALEGMSGVLFLNKIGREALCNISISGEWQINIEEGEYGNITFTQSINSINGKGKNTDHQTIEIEGKIEENCLTANVHINDNAWGKLTCAMVDSNKLVGFYKTDSMAGTINMIKKK